MTNYNIGFYNEQNGDINPPIQQGSTFELTFTCTDVFGGTLANDLTVTAQYRPITAEATHTDFTCTVLSRANGLVSVKLVIPSDVTNTMTPGNGRWDCEIADNATPPYVLKPLGSNNRAKVVAEVTRAA